MLESSPLLPVTWLISPLPFNSPTGKENEPHQDPEAASKPITLYIKHLLVKNEQLSPSVGSAAVGSLWKKLSVCIEDPTQILGVGVGLHRRMYTVRPCKIGGSVNVPSQPSLHSEILSQKRECVWGREEGKTTKVIG